MVRHGGSSAGSYLADPTSPIPSHCASIVMTSTLRVNRKGVNQETLDLPKFALLASLVFTHQMIMCQLPAITSCDMENVIKSKDK